MQEFIDDLIELDKQLDGRRKSEDSTVFKMSPNKLYKKALEKEKEQIVNAFENGIAEAVNEQHGKLDYNLDGKEYYEQKHNK